MPFATWIKDVPRFGESKEVEQQRADKRYKKIMKGYADRRLQKKATAELEAQKAAELGASKVKKDSTTATLLAGLISGDEPVELSGEPTIDIYNMGMRGKNSDIVGGARAAPTI